MIHRKKFLKKLATSTAMAFSVPWVNLNPEKKDDVLTSLSEFNETPREIARNEDYWRYVQQAFTVDRSTIYLNSAGVNPASRMVQESVKRYSDEINQVPSKMLGLGTEGILSPQIETVRQKLANVFGAHKEEIAIVRNATEGLVTCELGFDLNAGDEVLASHQIYGSMANTLKRRERLEGIKLNRLSLPVPAENEDKIVNLYEENITPHTKLIFLDHMSNKGQIFPVKKIINMARNYNISVIVDGAQTFGHLDFKQKDLGCDYFATSLHKWLSAPLGTGMLYVKKDKIKNIRSLMPGFRPQLNNIRKFEAIGTHPIGNYLAITEAIEFYRGIGAKRKENRLKYLNSYWIDQIIDSDRVELLTSRKEVFTSGIAVVNIKGIDASDLEDYLWKEYRIVVANIRINQPQKTYSGIRVTPNVFNTLDELDIFVEAMKNVITNGI